MPDRQTPLVSIVIPSHDYGHFLGDAIGSALGQGYDRVEIIVVDDGSTDNTSAVLERFAGRVRVLHLDGCGVSAARNAGLGQAAGEHVVLLDADDVLLPGGVAAQVARFAEDPELGAVVGAWYMCDVRLGVVALRRSSLPSDDVLPRFLRGNIAATPSAVMARRQALNTVGGFDPTLSFAADWDLWIRLVRAGYQIAVVETPAAAYRVHGRSMTQNLTRAAHDVDTVLSRHFSDPSLPGSARAVEPRSLSAIAQYLGRLALEGGDMKSAEGFFKQALVRDAKAADSLEFHHGMAQALWHRELLSGGSDVLSAIATAMAFADAVEPLPVATRRALRHLAAGMVAQATGAWGLSLRALAKALAASPATVLARSHASEAAKMLAPIWLTKLGRASLVRMGLRRATPVPLPPMVATMMGFDGDRRS